MFGFKYHVELSTRPEKSMGTEEEWNMAISALQEALEERKLPYKINEAMALSMDRKLTFI